MPVNTAPRSAPILLALLVPAITFGGSGMVAAHSDEKIETATEGVTLPEDPNDELLALGREVFTQTAAPQCALCHSLADAGATGAVGPSLDELKPEDGMVVAAVTYGVGVMPAYEDTLSEEQVRAVAVYVGAVAGAAKP